MTSNGLIRCSICNEIVKNEVAYDRHAKSMEHIKGLKILRDNMSNKDKIKKDTQAKIIAKSEEKVHVINEIESEINLPNEKQEEILVKILDDIGKVSHSLPLVNLFTFIYFSRTFLILRSI